MILIVGLGNIGEKYSNTRHNIGFLVLDSLLKKLTSVKDSVWEQNKKFNSFLAKAEDDILLAKPLTFMNNSGEAVVKIMNFYKIQPFGLYLVHDDVDLPLGKIKISAGHGSGGHKGVESVINSLSSNDFVRIRVGVGKDKQFETEKYVLSPFSLKEQGTVKNVVKKSVGSIEFILKKGVERAANKYN